MPVLNTEWININDKQTHWEYYLGILSPRKFVAIFPLKYFILVLQYFSLKTGSLSNRWLKPKFNYFFLALLHFFQKIHMSSFIRNCSICTHFRKYYIYWSNFLIIFVTNKIFKFFLPKKSLLHTSILLICTSHIRIGFSY